MSNVLFVWITILKSSEYSLLIQTSVHFWSILGLCFSLDPSTVPPSLHLSNSSLTVTYQGESPPGPPPDNKVRRSMTSDLGVTLALPQACADVVIARGQYYWEVDVCNSSVYRVGKNSLEFVLVGLMPVCLLLPETLTVSQQDCACLSPHSHVYTHAHVIRLHFIVHSATKRLERCKTIDHWLSNIGKMIPIFSILSNYYPNILPLTFNLLIWHIQTCFHFYQIRGIATL